METKNNSISRKGFPHLSTAGDCRFKSCKLVASLLSLLLLIDVSLAQYPISQQGHLLDANPLIGSFGLNTNNRFDSLIPRANLYVTGNVTGGANFQGLVPYRSPHEFQGYLGTTTLSNFRRDSFGESNLYNPLAPPTTYVDTSRSVTFNQGGQIYNTDSFNQTGIGALGATSTQRLNYEYDLSFRPFSNNDYSLGSSSTIPQFNPVTSGADSQPGEMPWIVKTPLNTPVPALAEPGILPQQWQDQQVLSPEQSDQTDYQFDPGTNISGLPPQTWQQEALATADRVPQSGTTLEPGDGYEQSDATGPTELPEWILAQPSVVGPSSQSSLTQPIAGFNTNLDDVYRQQFDYYMANGEKLMHQQMYYRAASAFGTAAMYNQKNPLALIAKAHALMGAGEFMSSAFFLNKALDLAPQLSRQKIDLSQVYFSKEKIQELTDELDAWYERTGNPMLLFLKGYILCRTNRAQEAHQVLTEAHRLRPTMQSIKHLLDAIPEKQNTIPDTTNTDGK